MLGRQRVNGIISPYLHRRPIPIILVLLKRHQAENQLADDSYIGKVTSCGGAKVYENLKRDGHVSLYLYFAALITFTCLPLLKIALSENLKDIYGFFISDKRMA